MKNTSKIKFLLIPLLAVVLLFAVTASLTGLFGLHENVLASAGTLTENENADNSNNFDASDEDYGVMPLADTPVTKPSLTLTELEWQGVNGESVAQSIKQYIEPWDDNAMYIVSGVSGREIDDYTVVIGLKPTFVWADTGKNENYELDWKIVKAKLQTPVVKGSPFKYDEEGITITEDSFATNSDGYKTFDKDIMEIVKGEGSVSFATVPDDYTLKIKLTDTTHYEWVDENGESIVGDTVEVTWSIEGDELNAEFNYGDHVVYGMSVFPEITGIFGEDKANITWYVENKEGGDARIDESTGYLTPLHAGNIRVIMKIKQHSHYLAREWFLDIVIERRALTEPKIDTSKGPASFEYDGNQKEVFLDDINYDTDTMEANGMTATAAGTHYVTVKLKDSENYRWLNNPNKTVIQIPWIIFEQQVDPGFYYDEQEGFYVDLPTSPPIIYNVPETCTYDFKIVEEGTDAEATVNPDTGVVTASTPGTVIVRLTVYSDGNNIGNSVITELTIEPLKKISLPVASKKYPYTGSDIIPVFTDNVGGSSDFYEVVGNIIPRRDVGTYPVEFRLKDSARTEWDITSGDKKANQIVYWEITPIDFEITFSYGTNNTIVYGQNWAASYNRIQNLSNGTEIWSIGKDDSSKAKIDIASGYITPLTVGTISVTLTIKAGNGSNYTDATKTVNVKIDAQRLTVPKKTSKTYTYNTTYQTLELDDNFDGSKMTVSNNSRLLAGKYTADNGLAAKITLRDKTNTRWDDGTENGIDDKYIDWEIEKAVYTPVVTYGVIRYNEKSGAPDVTNNLSGGNRTWSATMSDTTEATSPVISEWGEITAKKMGIITVTLTIAGNDNYADAVWTGEVIVEKAVLTSPKSLTRASWDWDGNVHTVTPNITIDTDLIEVRGTSSATAACPDSVESYFVEYKLKQPDCYVWDNGTVDNVSLPWRIERANVDMPTFNPSAITFTTEDVTVQLSSVTYFKDIVLPGAWLRDGLNITVRLQDSVTDNRSILFTPDDNHRWSDGTAGAKALELVVNAKEVSFDFVYYLNSDGEKQDITYTDYDHAPTVTVTDGDITNNKKTWTVKEGTGKATIDENTGVLTPERAGIVYVTLTISTTDNYSGGAKILPVEIKKGEYSENLLSEITWSSDQLTYNTEEQEITVTIPDSLTSLFRVKGYSGNKATNKGTYSATVELEYDTVNYNEPKVPAKTWDILPAPLSEAEVKIITPEKYIVYNGGTEVRPDFRINYLDLKSSDYTVQWLRNMNATDPDDPANYACLSILADETKNPNFAGQKEVYFIIRKADYDMTGISWDYVAPFVYDGHEKYVGILGDLPENVSAKDPVVLRHLKDGTTEVVTNPTEAGAYTTTVTFAYDEINYNDPSISCDWYISKADYDMTEVVWNTNSLIYNGKVQAVYPLNLPVGADDLNEGGTLKSGKVNSSFIINGVIDLGLNITATVSGYEMTDAGTYVARITFTTKSENYNVPVLGDLVWTIEKASYKLDGVVWNYSEAYTYSGEEQSVELLNMPLDVNGNPISATVDADGTEIPAATYSGAVAIAAGTYSATVTFNYDEKNYYAPAVKPCVWTISKADYVMDGVEWNYTRNTVYTYEIIDGVVTEYMVELNKLPRDVHGVELQANYDGVLSATAAGTYTAKVTFDYDDINYNKPVVSDCIWTIGKVTLKIPVQDGKLTYNGDTQTAVFVIEFDENLVSVDGNSAKDADNYFAVFSIKEEYRANYQWENGTSLDLPVAWEIGKDDYDMQYVSWNYTAALTFNGDVQGIELIGLDTLPGTVTAIYSDASATHVGTYTATVTGFNYDSKNFNAPVWTVPQVWSIQQADLKNAIDSENPDNNTFVITTDRESIVYKGEAWKPEYSITFCNGALKVTDYEEQWLNNIDAGTATLTLRAKTASRNFTGQVSITFEILQAEIDMSGVVWGTHDELTDGRLVYDGADKTYELLNLPDGIKGVLYGDNVKSEANTYHATAMLVYEKKNYVIINMPDDLDLTDGEWTISRARVEKPALTKTVLEYNGKPQTVEPDAKFDKNIMAITDNEQTKVNAANAPYYALISLTDPNYEWSDGSIDPLSLPWSIKSSDIVVTNTSWYYKVGGSDVLWKYDGSLTYDGEQKEMVLCGLPDDVTITYKGDVSATEAGKYTVSVELTYDENYNELPAIADLHWEIKPVDLSNVEVNITVAANTIKYNGKPQTPSFTATYAGLTASDYEVDWGADPVSAGKKTLKLKASATSRNFTGEKEVEFEVLKADYELRNVSWGYTASSPYKYNGNLYSVLLRGLEGLGITPDGEAADIEVLEYSGNTGTDVDVYVASVLKFKYDEVNYNAPVIPEDRMTCRWEIIKGDFVLTDIEWDYSISMTYKKGIAQEVKIIESTLPKGLTVKDYSGNSNIRRGDYEAIATFNYDADNYNDPGTLTLKWSIGQATYPGMEKVKWSYNGPFTFNNTLRSVTLTGLPAGVTVAKYNDNTGTAAKTYAASVAQFNYDEWNYLAPQLPDRIKTLDWEILPADLSNATLNLSVAERNITYNGALWMPTVVASYHNLRSTDYSVTYNDFVDGVITDLTANAGPKLLTITANSDTNFTGSKTYEYTVLRADFDITELSWSYDASSDEFVYDGTPKSVELLGLPAGVTANYSVAGLLSGEVEPVHARNYTTSVTLDFDDEEFINYNRFTYSKKCTWTIRKARLTEANIIWSDVDGIEWSYGDRKEFTFDGKNHAPTAKFRFIKADGDVIESEVQLAYTRDGVIVTDAVHAGSYLATAISEGDFEIGTFVSLGFEVTKLAISAGDIDRSLIDSLKLTYNGEDQTPTVLYKLDNGFESAIKLELVYNGSVVTSAINAGIYTATAISGDDFEIIGGEFGFEFEISKQELDSNRIKYYNKDGENEVEVDFTTDSFVFSGKNYMPIAKYLADDGKQHELTIMLLKDGSQVYSAVDAGSYGFAFNDANYEVKDFDFIDFTIAPLLVDPDLIVWDNADDTAFTNVLVFDGTNQTPKAKYNGYELPLEIRKVGESEPVASVTDAGDYVINVVSGGNFSLMTRSNESVNLTVNKRVIRADGVEWNVVDNAFVGLGENPNVEAIIRLNGKKYSLKISYTAADGGDINNWTAGTYTATATLEGESADNFIISGTLTRTFKISDFAGDFNGAGGDDGSLIWWIIILAFDALVFLIDIISVIVVVRKNKKANEAAEEGYEESYDYSNDDFGDELEEEF